MSSSASLPALRKASAVELTLLRNEKLQDDL
jgi:hypothetical protein